MATTAPNSKQIVIHVLEQISRIAEQRARLEIKNEAAEQIEHLRSGELNVVICGEAKRGKSSLINALLEEEDLCPPDAPVATNTITTIRYGETERFLVHLRDAEGKVTQHQIGRADIRDYVTEQGNTRNGRRVQLLEAWLPNPKLKDGLVLMDTPGVGSLNVEHTAVTYGIIPYADAVLFVCAADEPLTVPELDFCKRIAKHTSHIMLVVTKRDCVGNWSDILTDNLTKVSETLQSAGLGGVAVSSVNKLEYSKSGDEEDLENSGFVELERRLWDLLARRREILIGRAAGWGLGAIYNLRLPIKTEHDALSDSSPEALKQIEEKLAAALARAQELQSGQPFWVNELNRRTQNLREDANLWVAEQFAGHNKSLDTYLQRRDYLADPTKLAAMLTVDCNNGFALIGRDIETQLGTITADLRKMTQLQTIVAGKASMRGAQPIKLPGTAGATRNSWLGESSSVGRSFTIHAMGLGTAGSITGGIIGGILGTFVAPGVGTAAGAQLGATIAGGIAGLVGGIFGIQRGIQDLAEKSLASLRQNLAPLCREQLSIAQRTITHALSTAMTDARSQVHASLLREIQNEETSNREARASLAKDRQIKQSEVAGRLLSLNNQIKHLDNLERTLLALDEVAGNAPSEEPLRASA